MDISGTSLGAVSGQAPTCLAELPGTTEFMQAYLAALEAQRCLTGNEA
jgi:hypothetical protein